jgi:hypothetical protein
MAANDWETKAKVIAICGDPGSGRTTAAMLYLKKYCKDKLILVDKYFGWTDIDPLRVETVESDKITQYENAVLLFEARALNYESRTIIITALFMDTITSSSNMAIFALKNIDDLPLYLKNRVEEIWYTSVFDGKLRIEIHHEADVKTITHELSKDGKSKCLQKKK